MSRLGRDPSCLLYTSDAADDLLCVDLGGRRIIKKKKDKEKNLTKLKDLVDTAVASVALYTISTTTYASPAVLA